MSDKKIELTLDLKLLKEETTKNNGLENKSTEAWLENDDPTLLGEQAAKQENTSLDINPTISVSSLKIKQTDHEFILVTETSERSLKNNDIIKVGNQYYQVNIIKEYIVPAEQQEETFFDTLAFDHYSQERVVEDPLGFLYGDQSTKNALAYNSYDAFSKTNTKTLPYDQVPTLNSHISTFPSTAQNHDRRRAISQDAFRAKQGNVLNELGIDENNATIMHKTFSDGKSSYADQSPADLIDEYLNMQEYTLEPNAYKTVINNKKNIFSNMLGINKNNRSRV